MRFFVLSLMLLMAVESSAQKFLALDKGGRIKRLHFYPGDTFRFMATGSNQYIDGVIDAIGDSVVINGKAYAPADIKKVKVYRSEYTVHMLHSGTGVFALAAALYPAACAISASNQGDSPLITENQLKVTAGLLLMVPLFYRLTYHIFNTEKKQPLKIIDVSLK